MLTVTFMFTTFLACEICCLALMSGRLDSIDITSKWTRQEVTTCLCVLHINYTLPGDEGILEYSSC